jgi:hypothetical protein
MLVIVTMLVIVSVLVVVPTFFHCLANIGGVRPCNGTLFALENFGRSLHSFLLRHG